jgi:hypothetical protein
MSQPSFGIDIGAETIHVATGYKTRDKIHSISLADPAWWDKLGQIIPPNAIVAYEPTGWHYSAPVIAALSAIGATLIQVEHRVTGQVRALRVSGVKRDATDAQTLAFIAEQHADGKTYRGTRLARPQIDQNVTGLRMLMWAHVRVTKEITRCTNRLHQLSHSVCPILSQKLDTYLRAVSEGVVTPAELRTLSTRLNNGDYPTAFKHGVSRKNLQHLVNSLPPWLENETMRDAIAYEAQARYIYEVTQAELTAKLTAIISVEPFLTLSQLWRTVPNSHDLAIAALHIATHGQADQMTFNQFKATVGSHPHYSQSGADVSTEAARQGFKPAKKYLYLWSMKLIQRGDNQVATAFQSAKSRGKKYAIQTARAQLCAILSAIARTGQPYNPNAR